MSIVTTIGNKKLNLTKCTMTDIIILNNMKIRKLNPNHSSSPTAPVDSSINVELPTASDCKVEAAFGAAPVLGHIVVSSEKQSVTLPIGEKIPVIASDWKHAESLYNSMLQSHREVCRIVVGQSRQEYLPSEHSAL